MRTLLAALLLLAAPVAASAGPTLALRAGYDASAGYASQSTRMSEVAKGAVPLQLDALWRFGRFSIGGYYSFGFGLLSGSVADQCDARGADCTVWTMRTGIQAQWAFTEVADWWAPWIGGGIGYEWAFDKITINGKSTRQDVSGWELLSLQGGADAKLGSRLWLGPYVSVHSAQYSDVDGYGITHKAFHHWYGVGVRATWEF